MELPEFDFQTLALGLATISLLLCGVLMAGSALFGSEISDKVKRTHIPNTIIGLVMVGIASFLVGILSP
jgi:Ca2+/Na+ antiporter